jgi:hypothetical protein
MQIIRDSREQSPLDFTRMKYEVEAARSKAEESCSMIEQLDL